MWQPSLKQWRYPVNIWFIIWYVRACKYLNDRSKSTLHRLQIEFWVLRKRVRFWCLVTILRYKHVKISQACDVMHGLSNMAFLFRNICIYLCVCVCVCRVQNYDIYMQMTYQMRENTGAHIDACMWIKSYTPHMYPYTYAYVYYHGARRGRMYPEMLSRGRA